MTRSCPFACLSVLAALAAHPALASSYDESCTVGAGLVYEGGTLREEGAPDAALEHEITASLVLLERESVCENAGGERFPFGQKITAHFLRYASPFDGSTTETVAMCEEVYDGIPVIADATCVREFDVLDRRMGETGMVDRLTEADRAVAE